MIRPSDLREVTDADVYVGDELAAHLTREPGDSIGFNYAADYPITDAAIRDQSAAWTLLRSRDYPVTTTGGAVPAFFAGLLPEGSASEL